jgi:hypothetical protein
MKISNALALLWPLSSLFLAAGCAHHEKHSSFDETIYWPAYESTVYNNDGTAVHSVREPSGLAALTKPGLEQPVSPAYLPGDTTQGTLSTPVENENETDRMLIISVRDALKENPAIGDSFPGIRCTAQNGTVTLVGNVPSEEQKAEIETVVRRTSSVQNVNNQLRVPLSPTSDRSSQTSHIYSNATSQAQESIGQTPGSVVQPLDQSATATNQGAVSIGTPELSPTSDRTNGNTRIYHESQPQSTISSTPEPSAASPTSATNPVEPAPNNQGLSPTSDRAGNGGHLYYTNSPASSTGADSSYINAVSTNQVERKF